MRAVNARCLPQPRGGLHSGGVIVVAIVAASLTVLLVADRVAVIWTADRVARQIEDRGFSAKPHVSIAGFPFLTQVAARRVTKVVIRAEEARLGPVEVQRLDLTLHGIRVSAGGRTASRLSGTALVGFAGLARMTGKPGLTLSADGPDRVKVTAGLGRVTGVVRAGPGGLRIALSSVSGIPVSVLGPLRDITVPLPALPPGVTIQDVSVTGQGLLVDIAGQDINLGSQRDRPRHW